MNLLKKEIAEPTKPSAESDAPACDAARWPIGWLFVYPDFDTDEPVIVGEVACTCGKHHA